MSQAPPPSSGRRGELEAQFVSALPDIERLVGYFSRRHLLRVSEEQDFASDVKLALLRNDYEILARFQGGSSLKTYLATVIQRLFVDHCRRAWGKWRPSAEAERSGPLAVRLEALLYRDGLSLSEAAETLRTTLGAAASPEEIADLAARLPARVQRKRAEDVDLDHVPDGQGSDPQRQLEDTILTDRVQALLTRSLETLPARDRLIIRLRFEDGLSAAAIARLLKADQRQVYYRLETALATFKQSLESQGIGWQQIANLIERGRCHLCLPPRSEERGFRPSEQEQAT